MTKRTRLGLVLVWIPFLASLVNAGVVFWLNVGVSAGGWVELQAYVFAQTVCLGGIGMGIAGTTIVRAFTGPPSQA